MQEPAPRDRAPRQEEDEGAISGRVTDKGTSRPIGGAQVTLVPEGGAEIRETLTDADGRYTFSGLAAGKYAVTAGPGELRATHLKQVFGETEPRQFPPERPQPTIPLAKSEARTGVDLALVRALAIEGRVLDDADQPMTGVRPIVVRPDGTPFSSRGTESDDRGEYRLFGLPPGRYRVCAVPDGSDVVPGEIPSTSRMVTTCHPSSRSEATAADIILADTDASSIDIRMRREAAYTISGLLLDSAGVHVTGGHVGAQNLDATSGGSWPNTRSMDGRFELHGLIPGRYMLMASAGGPEYPGDRRAPARERQAAFQVVELGVADLDGVTVTLEQGETLRGRVRFEGGMPPAGVSTDMAVHLGPPFASRFDVHGWRAFVRADSTFQLDSVFRLPRVVGMTGLPQGWVVKAVRHAGRDITSMPVEFGAGAGAHPVQVVVTNRVARLTVRVMDERAKAGAARAVLLSADPVRTSVTYPTLSDRPVDGGEETFPAVLPGTYLLAAVSDVDVHALLVDRGRVEALAKAAVRVTLEEGEHRTIEVTRSPLPETGR